MEVMEFKDLHPETTQEWLIYYEIKEISLMRKDINSLVEKISKKGK